VIVAEPIEKEPAISEFILVEEEPVPINLEEVKGLIGYPQVARDAGIQGRVVIRILVDETGKYRKHRVINTVHPILTQACEEQIKKLAFTPAIQGGKPIKFWVNVPFNFILMD
jgi:protein TonB